MLDNMKMIPVNCPDAWEKFGNKKALVTIKWGTELKTFIANFIVRQNPTRIGLEIQPSLDGDETQWDEIHLSQEAVDMLRPIPNERGYDFVLPESLSYCHFRQQRKESHPGGGEPHKK